jgi:hypothetical protein
MEGSVVCTLHQEYQDAQQGGGNVGLEGRRGVSKNLNWLNKLEDFDANMKILL